MSEQRKVDQKAYSDLPIRHPIDWGNPEYFNESALNTELERVYDICHGCRRCVNLCHAFPTLFDLIDGSDTMEVDGVSKDDYGKVVDHCYLCDLCYLTKCPYVPPHEWNVDFPHLMLRAKAINHKKGASKLRDRVLTSTDWVGRFAGIPVVAETVNAVNKNALARKIMGKAVGIHADAVLPEFHSNNLRKRFKRRQPETITAEATDGTRGKVAIFITCYGNKNDPQATEDLITILRHNGISVCLTAREKCCGMPKLELGDFDAVEEFKRFNIPVLVDLIDNGWDIIAPVPSCVLMFKQELPLMFAGDRDVEKVQTHIFDPFEYLMLRHQAGKLDTRFKNTLGKVAYHVPCHQRVQCIGMKTREFMSLIPETAITTIERCSGHDGIYAVKREFHEMSMKLCRPITDKIQAATIDHYVSDCPMAGHQIANGMDGDLAAESPFTLIKHAYGIAG